MRRSTERILTTHAGSLPRTPALVALQAAASKGEPVDADELASEVEASTARVLDAQIEAGIDIVNNGEQARESFFTYVQHRMTGFGGTSKRPPFGDIIRYPGWMEQRLGRYRQGVNLTSAPRAEGAVAYADPGPPRAELEQFERLVAGRDVVETFVTAPSPGIIAAAMEDAHYGDLGAYLDDLGAALRTEYTAIVDGGHVLQLDCPDLALERHVSYLTGTDADFLGFVDRVIATIGTALDGLPPDRVRMHVCWGNYNGPHDLDISLATLLPSLTAADVGALMLSMANPRHAHEHKLLTPDALGDDQVVIAGVIDTTTNYVEHPEVVADRIEAVAQSIGDPTRVIAGTDCGFETSAGIRDVAPDVAWAKLASLSEGAALATDRLFG